MPTSLKVLTIINAGHGIIRQKCLAWGHPSIAASDQSLILPGPQEAAHPGDSDAKVVFEPYYSSSGLTMLQQFSTCHQWLNIDLGY